KIRTNLCRSCGECKDACAFDAPIILKDKPADIDADLCRGCGICVAQCPSGAIDGGPMDDAALRGMLSRLRPGATVLFKCDASGAAADGATLVVALPCAGRISAGLVAEALARGAKKVTVAACGTEECRYGKGAKLADERLAWLMEQCPDRIELKFTREQQAVEVAR
ncbi:MAG: hydrogenase iron-sulfur subunit, partial [Planctomycetota bacterium]